MKSRSERQKEAVERQEASNTRSPAERISHLDRVLGKGQGAVKERKRLTDAIAAKNA